MDIKLNFNFFNISFRVDNTPDERIPSSASQARKGGAQSAGIKGGALSSKPPTIHRYSALTVWILDKLSKAAGDWMMSNKERISKQVIDGKVVYLNKKDLEIFQRHMEGLPADNKLNNPISESEKGLTDWIEKWKTEASKTHGVALQHSTFKPQDGLPHTLPTRAEGQGLSATSSSSSAPPPAPAASEAVPPEAQVLTQFDPNREGDLKQIQDYFYTDPNDKDFEAKRDKKLEQFAKFGNAAAIHWLANHRYKVKNGNEIPVDLDLPTRGSENKTLLFLAAEQGNKEAFEALVAHRAESMVNNGRSRGDPNAGFYSVEFYQKYGELALEKGLSAAKQPSYAFLNGSIDPAGTIANAARSMFAQVTNVELNDSNVKVNVQLSLDGAPKAVVLNFDNIDPKVLDRFVLGSIKNQYSSVGTWDANTKCWTILGDQLQSFLRDQCKVVPYMLFEAFPINQDSDKIIAAEARSEKVSFILNQFGVPFSAIKSPSRNWQVMFKPTGKQAKDKLVADLKAILEKRMGVKANPLSESFQQRVAAVAAAEEDKEAERQEAWEVTLSSNETLHLLGFREEDQAIFDDLMERQAAREYIDAFASEKITPTMSPTYAVDTPYNVQLANSNTARGKLVEDLAKIGATLTIMSPPKGKGIEFNPPEYSKAKLPGGWFGKKVNPQIMKRRIGKNVADAIKEASNSESGVLEYVAAASQANGIEAPSRMPVPVQETVSTYISDHTQGPAAQIQYGSSQMRALVIAANRGFNGAINILSEATKSAMQHGYLTPQTSEMGDALIQQLKKNGHLLEYLSVENKSLHGPNKVTLNLVWAPAFGGYDKWRKLAPEQQEELQYLCTFYSTATQLSHIIKAGKPAHLSLSLPGTGVFGNRPEPLAKGVYEAYKKFENQLLTNRVTISFEVFRPGEVADKVADYLQLETEDDGGVGASPSVF